MQSGRSNILFCVLICNLLLLPVSVATVTSVSSYAELDAVLSSPSYTTEETIIYITEKRRADERLEAERKRKEDAALFLKRINNEWVDEGGFTPVIMCSPLDGGKTIDCKRKRGVMTCAEFIECYKSNNRTLCEDGKGNKDGFYWEYPMTSLKNGSPKQWKSCKFEIMQEDVKLAAESEATKMEAIEKEIEARRMRIELNKEEAIKRAKYKETSRIEALARVEAAAQAFRETPEYKARMMKKKQRDEANRVRLKKLDDDRRDRCGPTQPIGFKTDGHMCLGSACCGNSWSVFGKCGTSSAHCDNRQFWSDYSKYDGPDRGKPKRWVWDELRQDYIYKTETTPPPSNINYNKLENTRIGVPTVYRNPGSVGKTSINASDGTFVTINSRVVHKLTEVDEGSVDACMERCNKFDRCGGFVHERSTNKCFLKSNHAKKLQDTGVDGYDMYYKTPV